MKSGGISKYILYALAVIVTVGLLVVMNGPFFRDKPDYPIDYPVEGWRVEYQGQVFENARLDETNIGASEKGDVFRASHALPDVEVDSACIRVSTVLCALDVYVEDVLIYSFGHDRGAAGKMIPTRLHFVPLPENYAGKQMDLALTVYTDNAFSGFLPVTVGNRSDLQVQLMQDYRLQLFTGIFLILFAFILVVMSVYLVVYETSSARIYCSAFLLVMLGFYILSFYDLVDLLTDRPELRTIMEYAAFYLMPAAATAFIATIQEGRARRIIGGLAVFDAVCAIVAFIMHALGIKHIHEPLPLFQILFVLYCVPLFIFLVYSLVSGKKLGRRKSDVHIRASEMVLLGGVSYLFVAAIVDLIRYSYLKFFSRYGAAYSDISTTTHGALIFAACLIVNYFYYSIDFLNAQVMHERMRGLAYTDPLTNLANRTRCEEVMQRLNGTTDPYIIVSLDVNDLKVVNDREGHAAGDAFLSGFAKILTDIFGTDAFLIGRMGGDEFMAIFKETQHVKVQSLLDDLAARMQAENSRGGRFRYDAAWGVAGSDEVASGIASDVYMLADSRMYENKNARKRAKELSRKLEGGRHLHG
ncbi:MAG: GGDEF domain-containing protein [Lachnospiraceae bacterium]|nr:GGDEF domain-containing protein [Lachnospiraceae bacterium]